MHRLLTKRPSLAILVALAAALLALGGEAQAAWLPVEPIVASGPTASDPQVAVDGKGDVFVAWVTANPTNHAIVVSEHSAGGSWSAATQRIQATQDCQDPSLAVNAAGAAILVADCKTGSTPMRYAVRSVFGTWSTTSGEIPGSGSGKQPRAGIDTAGNLAVAWQTEGSPTAVDAVYALAGGGFGAVKQVSTAGKVASEPNLAMTPTGTVDLAWLEQRKENGADPVVQVMIDRKHGASEWTASGHLTNNFSTNPVAHGEPQIAINGEYQAVGWTQEASSQQMIVRNSHGDFGGFSEPIVGPEDSANIERPSIGIDRSGRSIATWLSFPAGPSSFELKGSSTTTPTSFWATPSVVEEVGPAVATRPALAVTPSGVTISAWQIPGPGGTMRASTRSPGGAFVPPVAISTVAQPGFEAPVVATDGEDGVVVWFTGSQPAVAVEDRTAPALAPTASAATIGGATSFTADATDAWGPISIAWEFGDGATATGATASHTYASAGAKTVTVTATDGAGNVNTATIEAEVTSPPPPSSGGGGNPPVSPPASPPQPAPMSLPSKLRLTAGAVAQPWAKQAKARGVRVRCKLDVAGRCAVVATVTKTIAKGLGLAVPKGKKPLRIGSGKVSAKADRFARVRVRLTAKALAAIAASSKPVPLTLAVTATAAGRDPAGRTVRLVLHP